MTVGAGIGFVSHFLRGAGCDWGDEIGFVSHFLGRMQKPEYRRGGRNWLCFAETGGGGTPGMR